MHLDSLASENSYSTEKALMGMVPNNTERLEMACSVFGRAYSHAIRGIQFIMMLFPCSGYLLYIPIINNFSLKVNCSTFLSLPPITKRKSLPKRALCYDPPPRSSDKISSAQSSSSIFAPSH
jgi:hypothetical protein